MENVNLNDFKFFDFDLSKLDPEQKDKLLRDAVDYMLFQKTLIRKMENLLIEYHIQDKECEKKWKG